MQLNEYTEVPIINQSVGTFYYNNPAMTTLVPCAACV